PRADFLTSIVLVAIGLGAAIESWHMPRLQNLGVSVYSAPGVVPFLLGLVIAFLGLILLVRSLRAGGLMSGGPLVSGDGARRFAIAAVLTLGYAIVLVDRLPFWAATAIFVAAFVLVFEWQAGIGGANRARRMATVAGFALATGLGVSVLFEDVFLVRLP
ncbi:MAG TPA: tripartite tricarboxylate transporter TctB family protein, partial [Aestuariivirgaceae bacterium]|nr:tripartite tricarboxylate transporter TctB family protein [Aestuariivirgaceae bacterium]